MAWSMASLRTSAVPRSSRAPGWPRRPPEPTDAEVAFERRATTPAMEPGHGQLARADRASGDHVVRHWYLNRPGGGAIVHLAITFVNASFHFVIWARQFSARAARGG